MLTNRFETAAKKSYVKLPVYLRQNAIPLEDVFHAPHLKTMMLGRSSYFYECVHIDLKMAYRQLNQDGGMYYKWAALLLLLFCFGYLPFINKSIQAQGYHYACAEGEL